MPISDFCAPPARSLSPSPIGHEPTASTPEVIVYFY
jgi:hypothetical protein